MDAFLRYRAYAVDFEPYISEVRVMGRPIRQSDAFSFRMWCGQVTSDAIGAPVHFDGAASWDFQTHGYSFRVADVLSALNASISKHAPTVPYHDVGASPLPYARVYPLDWDSGFPIHGYGKFFRTGGA